MTSITSKKMVAVALLASAAIAGCGGSDDESAAVSTPPAAATTTPAATTPASTDAPAQTEPDEAARAAVATTPEGTWASRTCKAMAGKAKELPPPAVDGGSPAATQKGLVTFFTSVVDQLGDQINTLEKVGPPPGGGKQESEWQSAVSELRGVRKDVAKAVREVKAAKADTAEDVQSIVAGLGKQLAKMSSYEGPIKELKTNPTLGPALEAEPTCQKVS